LARSALSSWGLLVRRANPQGFLQSPTLQKARRQRPFSNRAMKTSCILASILSLTSGVEEVPDPSGCAVLITGSIDDVVNSAYDIAQAALDCSPPALSQSACASDLTDMMSYWFNLANKISSATSVCGSLDNACAADITQAFGDVSDVSNNLIASAGDCVTDPFICSYDVVSAVDCVNGVVADILSSLYHCDFSQVPAAARDPMIQALASPHQRDSRLRSREVERGNYMERRLTDDSQEALDASAFDKLQIEMEDGFKKWAGMYRKHSNTSGFARKTHAEVQSAMSAAVKHLRAQLDAFAKKGESVEDVKTRALTV